MPPEEFRRAAIETAEWMAEYLSTVGELPVFPDRAVGDVTAAIPARAPEEPEEIEAILRDFREIVVPGINHWNHPSFFGYFAITGSGPGILGEMLTAALNVNGMVWRSSPAATELEDVTTRWLAELLGLPDDFEGVINDTSSSSSMYALAAAREQAYPDARAEGLFGQPAGRIYASDQAHSSIEKGVLALGFGRAGFRAVASDDRFRMKPEALRAALEEDVAAGLRPVAVVATLGTTSSASIDPMTEIADIAEEFGVWLHVDAAYGGPAALLPELRAHFRGWERADSVVVNPHKWLFTPIDCSVLFCRGPERLARAFSIVPEYLTSSETGEARNLMDYGVSLGRRFRSLKLWFVLRYFGRRGLADRIRGQIAMAEELATTIEAEPGWAVVAPVHFSTVAFRCERAGVEPAELDAWNREILDEVNRSGAAFLTHTELGGRYTLRLSIGNLKTTSAHVAETWSRLREAAERHAP